MVAASTARDDVLSLLFFFFNDTATTEIYTLSLHDALPILMPSATFESPSVREREGAARSNAPRRYPALVTAKMRSEEHTSELQSRLHLVCRLLLEKKKSVRTTNLREDYASNTPQH